MKLEDAKLCSQWCISLQNITHIVWSMQHIDFYCIFSSQTVLSFICHQNRNYNRNIYIYIVFIRNQLQHGTCSIPIGKEFCSYRCISMQNITHFSWIKQHATFIVYSSPTDRKCCRNNTSEMFWHFPEYRPFDRQYEIVRGKVICDFVGHVKILSGHVKFWNYVPDGHVLPGA